MKRTIHKKISNFLKQNISKIMLFFLAKGIRTLAKHDSQLKKEIDNWKENCIVEIKTNDKNVVWKIQKYKNKKGKYEIKKARQNQEPDLSITFKDVSILFKLATGRLGVATAYAQHRFMLKGEIAFAMSFVRVIDRTEAYLFPKIMTKRILKEVPKREKTMIGTYARLLLNI